jgi:hypothetical protein
MKEKVGPDTTVVGNLNTSLSSIDSTFRQKSKYPSTNQFYGWTGLKDVYRALIL